MKVPTPDREQVIDIKLGSFAIERACELWGVGLSEISTLYDTRDIEGVSTPIVKKPFDFAAGILWAGANYAALASGKEGYTVFDAYGWLDAIGGLGSEQLPAIYAAFFESLSGPEKDLGKKKGTKKEVEVNG